MRWSSASRALTDNVCCDEARYGRDHTTVRCLPRGHALPHEEPAQAEARFPSSLLANQNSEGRAPSWEPEGSQVSALCSHLPRVATRLLEDGSRAADRGRRPEADLANFSARRGLCHPSCTYSNRRRYWLSHATTETGMLSFVMEPELEAGSPCLRVPSSKFACRVCGSNTSTDALPLVFAVPEYPKLEYPLLPRCDVTEAARVDSSSSRISIDRWVWRKGPESEEAKQASAVAVFPDMKKRSTG